MTVAQAGVVRAPSGAGTTLVTSVATPNAKGAKKPFFFLVCPPCPTSLTPPPLPADLQGVSWDGPSDIVSRLVLETPPAEAEEEEEEPLYAVPRKEHLPKFTLDDFVLHKVLGKGSFGKVSVCSQDDTNREQGDDLDQRGWRSRSTISRLRLYMSRK